MAELDAPFFNAPLPGGSPGATVTMRPYSTGEIGVPRGFFKRRDEPMAKQRAMLRGVRQEFEQWAPCPFFVLQHPTAGVVLVDTGLPAAAGHDPKAALGRLASRLYAVRARDHQPLPARLRELGIPRGGVKAVLMTHMHYDHAGSLCEIENPVVLMGKREWRSAHGGKKLRRGYIRKQYALGHDFRRIDFDAPTVNSFASFGRSVDLFGDGSIIMVSTPGHTHGHMSVIVRLKDRECLIVGDAAYTRNSLDAGDLPLVMADEHKYKRSVREIRAYKHMTPSALVIPGHDATFFESLEDVY